jgi:general stress protein 26
MRATRAAVLALAAGFAVSASPAGPDARQAAPPSRAEILEAARTVMSQARYATLVTLDPAGQPQARVVDPFEPEPGFAIWIATNPATRKVAELQANPRVTLLYFDAARQSYVTVIGRATIVRDPKEKARRWKDEWAAFYKDRNRGDDYLLIRVVPTRLEIVAESLGMKPDPATWRPVIVEFK